ncbi:MAG: YfhO family protein [Thermodesulfobacteriota bacterium]
MAEILAILSLFIVSILFFYDLFEDRFLLTERDLSAYFIPPRFFWVNSIKHGDLPLWNPLQFCGHPFFANPQNALLYPFNGLFFLLPFDIAFNWIILLHFFLGGVFCYILLRDLKASHTASILSALIFMLSGYLLSVHSLLNILLSVIWTPLILLFFKRSLDRPQFKNEILISLFMALSFLGGGIEIVYGNALILFLMTILSLFHKGVVKKEILLRLKSLLIVSFFFLLLSAIQLIPFLELWMNSIRGEGIPYQEATTWSFSPKDFILFFLPDFYGYFLDMKRYWVTQCWLKTLYTGGLPFLLSMVYFFNSSSDSFRRRLFLSFLSLSLFLSLGRYNPLYPLIFHYIPFFNGIRYPVKFLYLFIFVLSITAGLGFEKLREFSRINQGKGWKSLFFALSLLSAFLLIFLLLGNQGIEEFLKEKGFDFPHYNHLSTNLYNMKRFLFYLSLFSLILIVGHGLRWKGWLRGLLLFFLILDLFGNMGFYGKERISDYFRKTKIQEIVSRDKGNFRVFSTPKTISMDIPILTSNPREIDVLREKHLPSFNMLLGIRDIWGIDVIRLRRSEELYRAFIHSPSISATRLLDLYGARYVISLTPIEDESRFELVYAGIEGFEGKIEELLKGNTVKLYRNKNPIVRGLLFKNYKVMNERSILRRLLSSEFDPESEVLLEETPPYPPSEKKDVRGEVRIIKERNQRILLEVVSGEEAILFLNDTYYPGWKAFVDGREERILRANYNFRAIVIPKGKHEVEFIYRPLSLRVGIFLSLMGFLLGMGFLFKEHYKNKTHEN